VGSRCWLGCEAHGLAGDRVSCGLRLKAHLSLYKKLNLHKK
jgi:hypothetical protein